MLENSCFSPRFPLFIIFKYATCQLVTLYKAGIVFFQPPFSFKETLQYCDEWRKFALPGGGANFEHVASMSSLQNFNQNY